MRIPHKVKIAPGIFYHVVWVDKFDDPEQVGWSDDGVGTKKRPKKGPKLIYLKKGMSDKFTTEIFIHEVLHAIEFEYELKLPHSLVYALQGPLALLLTKNPKSILGNFAAIPRAAAKRKRKRG